MISYIDGVIAGVTNDKMILEVNGIGYGIFVSSVVLESNITIGNRFKLFTYLNVREDAMQLFGFQSNDELELFKMIINVSGIGPKGGLAILSKLSIFELREAVILSDVKKISSAQGIGKKTAEKLIIELKDKMDLIGEDQRVGDIVSLDSSADNDKINDVLEAMMALGYDKKTSKTSVEGIQNISELSVEDILKIALKNMMF